ncbi:vera protein [Microdochium trichocladiopsis]|uniref:Vera protein n=1 Tax=Microdochium trichocladiopsis TaxID=1682393 RepID=A0A9P8Y738_9PEZI|nr:vera protein [Microdochium trichocladiopsis]KAH7029272.1 vera protein [Microdochium trichocladiopsis]
MTLLAGSGTTLVLRGVAALVTLAIARFVYKGYNARRRVQRLRAQGIPLLPHSWLWGHLKVMGDFRNDSPDDANIYEFHGWLKRNMAAYFPGESSLPGVVYLDIWPFSDGLAIITDADMVQQFMQKPDLPKSMTAAEFLKPLTNARDIVSIPGGAEWKLWRTRFNPSFSPRNIQALLPQLLEEVEVFVDVLRSKAGRATAHGNAWGPMFQLHEKAINLTFDIILRAAVDIRLREQSRETESPLKIAMTKQIEMMSKMAHGSQFSLGIKMPWDHKAIADNNKVIASYVIPEILTKIGEAEGQTSQQPQESQNTKTAADAAIFGAVKDKKSMANGKGIAGSLANDSDFMDKLIANLKAFLFAGHDTTATTICFMTHELGKRPECLQKLRDEHDEVLGPDPSKASAVLHKSPHLMYQLPYTTAVIKETLRLHPLAATLRDAPKDFSLVSKETGVAFPLGSFAAWLSAPILAIDERYWAEPYRFMPERWLVAEGDPLYSSNRDAWAPFSLGPRNCIGMELALMELRLVSVLTARVFDIEEDWEEWDRSRGEEATPDHKFAGGRLYGTGRGTVHPKDGMPVHLRLAK